MFFFIHVKLQATCEMVNYFALSIRGGGYHVLKIVKQRCIAGGAQCPKKALGIDKCIVSFQTSVTS